jgi:hypothetical protein
VTESAGASGFAELDRLTQLFRRTRAVLDAVMAEGSLPDGGGDLLADETLPHIEDVEHGFRVRLRAAEAGVEELRVLVLQTGLGLPEARDRAEERAALAEAMIARSGVGGEREIAPAPARRLAALEHARLVFALLPATPREEVHYPAPTGLRSYADIPAPRTPAELSLRIEELEREVWRLATGRPPRLVDAGYRRTYGFFDAAEWLMRGIYRLPD